MRNHETATKYFGEKREYRKPELIFYGQVRDLTRAAGGSPQAEGNCGQQRENTGTRQCCDRNAKQNIVHIGTHSAGFGLYLFDYKRQYRAQWGVGRQFGVMADEVEAIIPEAVVIHPDGYKMVDYALLGISRNLH